MSEDPIKDGTNWYSYCAGNPVMFVDPLGLKMYNSVMNSATDNQTVISILSTLSNRKVEVNDDGNLYLSDKVYDGTVDDKAFEPMRNELNEMMKMDKECEVEAIYSGNSDCIIKDGENVINGTNGVGVNVTLRLNVNGVENKIKVAGVNGVAEKEKYTAPEILATHEMFHAYSSMTGTNNLSNLLVNYSARTSPMSEYNDGYTEFKSKIGELMAVGIVESNNEGVNENYMRTVLGYAPRVIY